jgi:hypothetical protein
VEAGRLSLMEEEEEGSQAPGMEDMVGGLQVELLSGGCGGVELGGVIIIICC